VNAAELERVAPAYVHVTVWVPVPGVVDETVRYVQLTTPLAFAITVGSRPCAVLRFPDGSRACAVHDPPGVVVAETNP